jgi:protein-disulfide isomerase
MRHHGHVNDLDPIPADPADPATTSMPLNRPTHEAPQAAAPDEAPWPNEAPWSNETPSSAPASAPLWPEPVQPEPGFQPERAGGPPRASGQNRVAVVATMVALIVLSFGAGFATSRLTTPSAEPDLPTASAETGVVPTPAATGIALPSDGARLGSADATVVVEYWADYQCPFCSKFATEVIPQLTDLIADGTVALVHRDYAFIGPESTDAAVAVRCAIGEGRYWQMHDAVYAAQSGENQGAFARARLAQIAASVGLDGTAFAACMDDHAIRVAVLDDTAAGVRTGIVSTPTVDVNGHRFLGVPPVAELLAAIEGAAAGASPAPLPTAEPAADPWTGTATDGRTAGDAAAPLTVELWMDYQSTAAAAIVNDLEPGLRERVAAGDVQVVRHDLALLGDESVLAAATVRCTERQDGPGWFIHDILAVSAQGAGAGIFTVDNILTLAARLGLRVADLDACLADGAAAAEVTADTADGTALGLTAGPAVIVSRGGAEVTRLTGTLDAAAILAAIDAAINAAG